MNHDPNSEPDPSLSKPNIGEQVLPVFREMQKRQTKKLAGLEKELQDAADLKGELDGLCDRLRRVETTAGNAGFDSVEMICAVTHATLRNAARDMLKRMKTAADSIEEVHKRRREIEAMAAHEAKGGA